MEKLCMFCEFFKWDAVDRGPDYSEYTGGGMEGGATCDKRHFSEERPIDTAEFRLLILRAETCPDYMPPNAKAQGREHSERPTGAEG